MLQDVHKKLEVAEKNLQSNGPADVLPGNDKPSLDAPTTLLMIDSLAREIAVLQDQAETADTDALSASKARVEAVHDALIRLETGL